MTAETKARIKYACENLEIGRTSVGDAWEYCNKLERLNCSDAADVMKTLVKAYDAWCKRYGMTASKAIKL